MFCRANSSADLGAEEAASYGCVARGTPAILVAWQPSLAPPSVPPCVFPTEFEGLKVYYRCEEGFSARPAAEASDD